jgi:hypothetical protein
MLLVAVPAQKFMHMVETTPLPVVHGIPVLCQINLSHGWLFDELLSAQVVQADRVAAPAELDTSSKADG